MRSFVNAWRRGLGAHGNVARWAGRIVGTVGLALCAVAIAARAAGMFVLGSLQVGTVFQGAMAALLIACVAYLAVIAERPGQYGTLDRSPMVLEGLPAAIAPESHRVAANREGLAVVDRESAS